MPLLKDWQEDGQAALLHRYQEIIKVYCLFEQGSTDWVEPSSWHSIPGLSLTINSIRVFGVSSKNRHSTHCAAQHKPQEIMRTALEKPQTRCCQ